ncbi:MAG: dehydrogenase E1 component subunit alpha/beta [Chitinophagales bacterium]|nr:dehydrogenase E1 component subunit alpha/beta [Chitinophagales bacterium]
MIATFALLSLLRMITYNRLNYDNETLLALYKAIVKPRVIEEKMLNLLRQGKISKWFSGIGQEAIAVGATMALDEDEYIMPLHRNLGVFTTRNMPFLKLFNQWQGNENGFSKGRERSFHFGSNEHHIVGMISHLGPQLTIANGIALAHQLRKENKVALAFTGEGGTSEGDFHEALNVASVWNLPVIFLIENNGYGLSTPSAEQFRCKQLADRAIGYGMEGITVDGNNIIEMYDTIKGVRDYCLKNQRPYLVECMTFRMRGHEEASGTKYVPKELIEEWGKKDPVTNYENYLVANKIISSVEIEDIRKKIKEDIEADLQIAFSEPPLIPNTEKEMADVYAPVIKSEVGSRKSEVKKEMRLVDAIAEAMRQAMEKHDNLILMGQDIAEYGGVFKITDGLLKQFGKERVRNTPLCESAIVGAALGLSIKGFKSMMEMQFADFVTVGFNQIINNLAKSYYRWGQNADVVIRMPTGTGVGAGPFHSQSNEAWFTHTPGLKVVYPSTPYDAKGLLLAAFEDPNPVMYFEHKQLYRSISGMVPEDYYTIEIGKANLVSEGVDVSIITYGAGVHWAMEEVGSRKSAFANTSADKSEVGSFSADILDLRTLLPFDKEAIETTVKKTGKVIILHEDCLTGGIGGEIAAWISENFFEHLDAPVMRCASLDTPVPFAIPLENNFLPKERFKKMLSELVYY